jgi:hypothetical protein
MLHGGVDLNDQLQDILQKGTGKKRILPTEIVSPKLLYLLEKITGCVKVCALHAQRGKMGTIKT